MNIKFVKVNKGKVLRILESCPAEVELRGVDKILPAFKYDEVSKYPEVFYTKSSVPTFTVEEDKVLFTYPSTLEEVDTIKTLLYSLQKEQRQLKQLGVFSFLGKNITLKDREDSLIISSLPEQPTKFKTGLTEWVELDGNQVADMKVAHNSHVQAAYSWEMQENYKVLAMMTIEELDTYYRGLAWA